MTQDEAKQLLHQLDPDKEKLDSEFVTITVGRSANFTSAKDNMNELQLMTFGELRKLAQDP